MLVRLAAVCELKAFDKTVVLRSEITDKSLARTESTKVGFTITPLFATVEAIIALSNGVVVTSA